MEKLPAQKKKDAVLKVITLGESVSKVAEDYKVARKTLYCWIKRYKESGSGSLNTRYLSGKDHPNSTPPGTERKLLALVAKAPEFSIDSLSNYVPVSTWTIWCI